MFIICIYTQESQNQVRCAYVIVYPHKFHQLAFDTTFLITCAKIESHHIIHSES